MKRISLEKFSKEPGALLKAAQTERVLVVQKGKPLALILGLEFKDEEDYALEQDTEFWQMIRERRQQARMVPLAEAKKRLGITNANKKPGARKGK